LFTLYTESVFILKKIITYLAIVLWWIWWNRIKSNGNHLNL